MTDPAAPIARREPFFGDLPRVVIALSGVITAVTAVELLGPIELRGAILATFAFIPGAGPGEQPLGSALPYALHVLVHGGWAHLAMNILALIAFGAVVARRWRGGAMGAAAFLFLFFASAIAGAFAESLRPLVTAAPMVGASSGVSGVVGAAIYLYRAGPDGTPPALWSPRYLVGAAPWALINVALAFTGGVAPGFGNIAWAAHLGGLAAGAVLFPVIDRALQNSRS